MTAAAIYLASLAVGALITGALLVGVPASFLEMPPARSGRRRVGWGLVLLALGGILALPGVPGRALPAILGGALLLALPDREEVEGALRRHAAALRAINWLRARFHRPPLRLHRL